MNRMDQGRLPGYAEASLPIRAVPLGPTNAPSRTLSSISINAMPPRSTASTTAADPKPPSDSTQENRPGNEHSRSYGPTSTPRVGLSNMVPPSNLRTNGSTPLAPAQLDRSPPHPPRLVPMSTSIRNISAEFGGSRSFPADNDITIAEDSTAHSDPASQQWNSAVGKANLGKTSRVIERLMNENDMLKRDLKFQRLQAEDAKNELKAADQKAEQFKAETNSKLHDASINETLLKRRDRQILDLKAQIDVEKHRADTAVESEKYWKQQMERTRQEGQLKVEESSNYAMLLEGRNNVLSKHWKEKEKEITDSYRKIQKQISAITAERKQDHEKFTALQATCDQQATQYTESQKLNERLFALFEAYKAEKERGLKEITTKAASGQKVLEELIEEATINGNKLKWALQLQETRNERR